MCKGSAWVFPVWVFSLFLAILCSKQYMLDKVTEETYHILVIFPDSGVVAIICL